MLLGLIRPPARRCSSPLSFKANSQGARLLRYSGNGRCNPIGDYCPGVSRRVAERGRLLQTDGHAGETERHLKSDLWSLHLEDDALFILQRCSFPTDDECSASASRTIGPSDI